jgi:predicted amidohydrolase
MMQTEDITDRRRFLKQTSCLLPLALRTGYLLNREGNITVSSSLFPQQDLVVERSQQFKKKIEDSLAEKNSRPVVIGVYQMRNRCGGVKGKEENLNRMLRAITEAQRRHVQVLVFPEMCLPGYFTPASGTATEAVAANHLLADEVGSSQFLTRLQEAAAKARMVLAFGFAEVSGSQYFDSAGLIDSNGAWLGVRRKNPRYPWAYETESFTELDPSMRSAVFETRYGKFGVSICFDGEFPESIRQMRLDGAEMLLWLNAAVTPPNPGSSNRLNYSGAYAQSNFMWVACANCVSSNTYGTSCVYSPWGEPLVILSTDREEIGIARVNLKITEDWSVWRDRLWPKRLGIQKQKETGRHVHAPHAFLHD